jgi:DNA replication factor GINS
LIVSEARNARRILTEIARLRSDKLTRKAASGEKPPSNSLTVEEERLFDDVCALGENYQVFIRGIIEGRSSQATPEREHKFLAVRFLQDLPAIVGTDMKTYGPFKAEDIATLPLKNAKLLTQRNSAGEIGAR